MPSISSLANILRTDYPQFYFTQSDDFHWASAKQTISYRSDGEAGFLLHELGHALLGHKEYTRDVQLIELEQEAWAYAKGHLSSRYGISMNEELIEEALNSYRDWLHARSTCPTCTSTGIQTKEKIYSCMVCFATWEVNEARLCRLKRRLLTT